MTSARSGSISLPLKAGWGLGSVGTQIILFSQSLLLLYYFTMILDLQPALAGSLLFGAKIFDALLAPVVGSWTDRLRTRIGRRRPFLLAGAILSSAGLYFVFNPPTPAPLVLLLGLMLISLGYSSFNIPYLAMTAEMTDSPVERTSLMSWRIAFVGVGTLVATSLLPVVAKLGGGNRAGYGLTGMVAAALVLASMLSTFLLTARARATVSVGEPFSIRAMIGAVLANRPFGYLLLAKILQLVGLAASSASMLFFFKDVIGGNEGTLALWGGVANGISIVSMLVWPTIGRRYGKVAIYGLSVVGYSAFGFSWLLTGPGTGMTAILLRAFGSGIFVGGLLLMGQSLIPDAIGEDFLRTGLRREGIFAGAYSFVEKASSAIGPMIVGFLFQFMGFSTHGSSAGGDTRAVYLCVAVIPPLAYLLSLWPVLLIRIPARAPDCAPVVMPGSIA
jgi:GPH family glycoside/pentoside/hexuronide:cation symporter